MWSDLRFRLRSLLFRRRVEAELDDELRFHLEQAIRRSLARGASPEQAEREARLEVGGIEQLKEDCRDARGVAVLEDPVRDLRLAARRLLRDWRFSVPAVLVLALGIGANAAIFSVVNAALFRGQPFADPERLVEIYQNDGESGLPQACTFPVYQDIARYHELFSGVAAARVANPVRYQAGEGVRPAVAEHATSTYLEVLGLEPARGRWFDAREDQPGAEATAVLGHVAWRTKFASDPDVLGRTLRVNGVPVTVVGVGPAGFDATLPIGVVTDLWLSVSSLPAVSGRSDVLGRGVRGDAFLVKARLRPGVTVPQARAAMEALGGRRRPIRSTFSGTSSTWPLGPAPPGRLHQSGAPLAATVRAPGRAGGDGDRRAGNRADELPSRSGYARPS